ncbi:DNA-directed RNA polymerase subunit alpha C-terminal domain-containing protein [Morganella morganii]|nr:DNA-directed RNA polymerase subunit alpha C-terminal domain-containing protein [Morganella morganii]
MARFEILTRGDSFPEILELGLSVRAANCLKQAGIVTTGLLLKETEVNLLRIPGIGSQILREIIESIKPFGLKLKKRIVIVNKFKHLMIDLEVMAKKPDGAIAAIAAVPFDMVSGVTDDALFL